MRRETADRQRQRELEESPVSTCTAGGKMFLLMDPSFLQHSTAKTSQGTKIWHYYYYGILQLSIIPSLSLSFTFTVSFTLICANTLRHTHINTCSHTPLIFPQMNTQKHKHLEARVWAKASYDWLHVLTLCKILQFYTVIHWSGCPTVQLVHGDSRICTL